MFGNQGKDKDEGRSDNIVWDIVEVGAFGQRTIVDTKETRDEAESFEAGYDPGRGKSTDIERRVEVI